MRIQPALLAKANIRAAQLGLDRGKYLRDLIERDLSQDDRGGPRKFASEDFIGSASLGRGPYTNERVRAVVRQRLRDRHAKNR
jgi:hypothetical protein